MREIKFRFWSGKKMSVAYSLGDLSYEGFPPHYQNEHGDLNKKCVVMQFTGLKDINGVEIYEGDVVMCSSASMRCPHQVIWEPPKPFTHMGGWNLKGLIANYDWIGTEELLGNIYETPELLSA